MISVIKLDNKFIELLKDKKEMKISDLIFCYENLEILGSCLVTYLGDKTNTVMIQASSDDNPINKDIVEYIIFQPDNKEAIMFISEANWRLLEPHLFSYNMIDAEMSVKYSTIFYVTA